MADHRQLVTDYVTAVGDGRIDEVGGFLDPDVSIEIPGGAEHFGASYRGAGNYLAALRRLAPVVARSDVHDVLVDGDQACVFYDFVTDTPAGPVACVERLTVAGGRITSVYLLFDKARWPEVMAALRRKAGQ